MSLAIIDPNCNADEAAMRRAMIDSQLRTNGINEPSLLAAIAAIARTDFLPEGAAARAYIDRAIPLTASRSLNPVLSTARLIADANIVAGQKILLIGAASGYAAAILAAMGAQVTAVESDAALLALAHKALGDAANITLVEAPLAEGAPTGAPYDGLLIDGAVESVPESLIAQLAPGARIATGLVDIGPADAGVTRLARAVKISGSDAVRLVAFADFECVRLPGFSPPPVFTF
ncbi:MAG: protein-L-isoaspartate O-methyltransferase [Sphingopyxis sp.]